MNEMMMTSTPRSTVRMKMFAGDNNSVENAFLQTRAFLVVRVNRIIRWIEDQQQQQQHEHNQVQSAPPASIDTSDVIPSIQARFPLSFQYMFSDMNLQHLDEEFNQLLNDNFITQDFCEEFTGNVSYGIKSLADFAIQTRSSVVVLHVVVDVVRTKRYNEEQFLRHILTLRTANPSTFNPEYDQSSSKIMPASREAIDALETITFKRSVPSGNGTGDEEMVDVSCSICLDEYSDGEKIMKMSCSHWFHSGCIDRWFKKMNTCPLCRFQIS